MYVSEDTQHDEFSTTNFNIKNDETNDFICMFNKMQLNKNSSCFDDDLDLQDTIVNINKENSYVKQICLNNIERNIQNKKY